MYLPRHADIWLLPYLRDRLARLGEAPPKRVWVAVTDHHEPYRSNQDHALARTRVARWRRMWPEIAQRHTDSTGRPAQHSFFYPQEDYRPELLESLAEMQRLGLGDVEVHIHHDNEGEALFVEKMELFLDQLENNHGLLHRDHAGRRFGFIHGNWALDNSRPDGRWCGLNNELLILARLGCYADFTMPCSPSAMQPRTVNQIYWAQDDPQRPKSYDVGVSVRPGGDVSGDLMMITGPFGVRLDSRSFKPKVEIGELASHNPPTPERVRFWMRVAPRVGTGDAFIKLFTHGSPEDNADCLLNGGFATLFESLRQECTRLNASLHFVTAWELYRQVEAVRMGGVNPPTGPAY